MPKPVHLLIKPASGACNLRCKYCFYADITEKREVPSFGMMSEETLQTVVQKTLEHASGDVTFAFQGGEPTLRGLPFFRRLMEYEARYNVHNLPIHNAIQTNGILLDGEWADFFAENRFLVGLSMDGSAPVNDLHRVDASGDGTHKRLMQAARLLKEKKVEFNILTVVTAKAAKEIKSIYAFYRRSGLPYQQYIPCLDPIGEARGGHPYSLTPALYERFLKDLFDLWFEDVTAGRLIYNRYFENLVGMLLGHPPEACGMIGFCSRQYVVEADGGVYPCDFYVLDGYRIGSLVADSFETIEENRTRLGFVETSRQPAPECLACRWQPLCRGGCRRDREPELDGRMSLNYFCPAYKGFFAYAYPRLEHLARAIAAN
jgi:uncharacterized protein